MSDKVLVVELAVAEALESDLAAMEKAFAYIVKAYARLYDFSILVVNEALSQGVAMNPDELARMKAHVEQVRAWIAAMPPRTKP